MTVFCRSLSRARSILEHQRLNFAARSAPRNAESLQSAINMPMADNIKHLREVKEKYKEPVPVLLRVTKLVL